MRKFCRLFIHRAWSMVLVFICLGGHASVQAQVESTSATNPVVQFGSGAVDGLGTSHVTVHQATQQLGINWNSLGNNPGEVLQFIQPSINSIAFNRIVGGDPSHFLGSLIANGSVIVINPNGVWFSPTAQVNVNGLIASSLNLTDTDFLSGRYAFQGNATNGAVRNEGQITAGSFGVYLLAPNVTNNGVIRSSNGHIALAAGTTAYLSDRADGRGFLVEVTAPAGEALNLNSLIADGGQVSMIGRLVTQSGLVQANTVQKQNGKIHLVAAERATLTDGSVTEAIGAGGDISLVATNGTVVTNAGSSVRADGGTISLAGQTISHAGNLQAKVAGINRGSVSLTASTGTVITVNGSTIVADGGDVTVVGQSVDHQGTIQANSVVGANGRIETGRISLLGTSALNVRSSSRTIASGGVTGAADGGTIHGEADLAQGSATIESGAVIDASGGAQGGREGFADFGAASLTLNGQAQGRAAAVFRNGQGTVVPIVTTNNVSLQNLSPTGLNAPLLWFESVSLGQDMNVNGITDIGTEAWRLPNGQTGVIRFSAGNDLVFGATSFTSLRNGQLTGAGASGKWDYFGTARNDVTLNGTDLTTGLGGNITLAADNSLRLLPGFNQQPFVRTLTGGGNITLIATRGDLIASSARGGGSGPTYTGIRLQGSGDLTITAGGDFKGGQIIAGQRVGPGFVLSEGTARVNVGGTIGALDSYAVFTVGNQRGGTLTLVDLQVTAGEDIYLANVQDRGIAEATQGVQPLPSLNQASSATFTSLAGDIHLQPPVDNRPLSRILPPSFHVKTNAGNIFVESDLDFWPSPTRNISFSAGNSIVGVPQTSNTVPQIGLCQLSGCPPISNTILVAPAAISLTAVNDVRTLKLDFTSAILQTVTLSAGRDIREVFGAFSVPDLRLDPVGRIDANGTPVAAVAISAGRDIDLTVPAGRQTTDSGFVFGGTGVARISAGRTLELGDSRGIVHRLDPNRPMTDGNKGGLLDIAVGGDLNMNKSRISTENGANIFVHGLDVNRLDGKAVVLDGRTELATTAMLNTMTVQGQTVLAVGGQPVQRSDGSSIVYDPTNPFMVDKVGKPIYLVDGRPALGVDQLPLLVDPNDAIAGKEVLTVGGIPAFGISNRLIVVDRTASASFTSGDLAHGTLVMDRTPVRLPDGTIVVVANGKVALAQVAPGGSINDGKPTMTNGTLGLLVGNQPTSLVEPLGGSMNVGTNQNAVNFQTGIVTLRGGSITAKVAGDINVERSRIAAFGAGDVKRGSITLTSTTGDINAGFGSKNDVASFVIDQGVKLDAQGNPIIDPVTGQPVHELFFAPVPASGIFTFHAKDPFPLKFPVFNPVSPFETMVRAHELFGHDVSALLPQIPAAQAAWKAQYEQTFLRFIADKKLGDVSLTAAKDVVIPSGGLRGALIEVNAGRSFNVSGKVEGLLDANTPFFFGTFANLVGLFNISGLSSSQSSLTLQSVTSPSNTITISSNAVASVSSVFATSTVAQQVATESPAEAVGRRGAGGGKGNEGGQKSASLRVKDKVRIKVETQREPVAQ